MLPFGPDRPVFLGPDLVAAGFEIDAATGTTNPLPFAAAIERARLSSVVVNVLPGFTLRLLESLRRGEALESGKKKQEADGSGCVDQCCYPLSEKNG